MNVLFLGLTEISDINQSGMYPELLQEFHKNGHHVYCVSTVERRSGKQTAVFHSDGSDCLVVRTLNIQKTNLLEKGIGTLLITNQMKRAIRQYFGDVKFDLILYPTPPITLLGVVQYFKERDGAETYLMLKDIFPQNAVDLGMMKKTGALYRYFRRKERLFYAISDTIGCMSRANVDYVLAHNRGLEGKVELCPNSVRVQDAALSEEEKTALRQKYGLPTDRTIFVYGGNLGRPQGIPFLIDCLRAEKTNPDAFFLVVGQGTEYKALEKFAASEQPENFMLLSRLPREDYQRLAAACDVGMIFLDHRFTIPNFPSRLLSCMQAEVPVLACTDPNTDVGTVITEGGFGWWAESNDTAAFSNAVRAALTADRKALGQRAKACLKAHYTVEQCYQTIMNSVFQHPSLTDRGV